jgi:Ig-like domain-containing protein
LINGDLMRGQNNMPLPVDVAPGQTIDIAMNFTAPLIEGDYRGNWQIRNEKGEIFGTTATANRPFWVDIQVKTPALTGTIYDFVANVCSAQWFSGAGALPCPGKDRDVNGFVLKQSSSKLEDGTTAFSPSLLTVPQNTLNGYIRAVYPSVRIQSGDRLQVTVNCEGGATRCGVLFRVDYQLADGLVRDFWAFGEQYDGKYFAADLDLNPLAGQNVKFVFTILSIGDASNDRALWVQPRIVR